MGRKPTHPSVGAQGQSPEESNRAVFAGCRVAQAMGTLVWCGGGGVVLAIEPGEDRDAGPSGRRWRGRTSHAVGMVMVACMLRDGNGGGCGVGAPEQGSGGPGGSSVVLLTRSWRTSGCDAEVVGALLRFSSCSRTPGRPAGVRVRVPAFVVRSMASWALVPQGRV